VSGTSVSVVVVVLLLVSGVGVELTARRRRDRATVGQAVGAAMRTIPGRVTVLLTWAWLGLHFLAR
jgi:hypothetical protein